MRYKYLKNIIVILKKTIYWNIEFLHVFPSWVASPNKQTDYHSLFSLLNVHNFDVAIQHGDFYDICTSPITKIILENNYFEFEEGIFHQKLGTAIGTKLAPSFNNIFYA